MNHFAKLGVALAFSSLVACTASSPPSNAGTTTSKETTGAKKKDATDTKASPGKKDTKTDTSGDQNSGEPAPSCGLSKDGDLTTTNVTAAATNDPSCPVITPESINADLGKDDEDSACQSTFDKTCKLTLDCPSDESSAHGEFVAANGKLEGNITITATRAEGAPLVCTYAMTMEPK